MEDPQKIQRKLDQLNGGTGQTGIGPLLPVNRRWIAVPGYFVVTGFNYGNGNPIFNANFGYPLKLFVNEVDGEMKFYPASLFEG